MRYELMSAISIFLATNLTTCKTKWPLWRAKATFLKSFPHNIKTIYLQNSVLKFHNNLQLWNPAYNNREAEVPVCSPFRSSKRG